MRAALPLLLLVGCGRTTRPDPSPDPAETVFRWEVDDARFVGDPITRGDLFTLAATDMDGDGDDDVYLQRHHMVRSELFENVGGHLVQLNTRDDDRSGVFENPGLPDLFGPLDQMGPAIDARVESGLYLWHDESRGGAWRLQAQGQALELRVRGNRPITVGGGQLVPIDEFASEGTLAAGARLSVSMGLVATQLVVDILSPSPPPMYLGSTMVLHDLPSVELWKPDPHGLAWVDQEGGPEPELFLTRGGLTGLLAPPFDPKQDPYFTWTGGELRYDEISERIPRDWCRGRQVSWLDVDLDGVDELFVSCTETANKLLDRDGDGPYADVAEAWGLASVNPETFAWVDVDRDGVLDLLQNREEALEVLLHRGDHFEARSAGDFGLVSPVPPSGEVEAVFNPFTLQALDLDRDGDLDVIASHFGDELGVAVLRSDPSGFVDVSQSVGLAGATGFGAISPVDVDRDGWIDLYVAADSGLQLFRNIRGTHFTRVEVPDAPLIDAVAADIDGDGFLDLVGQGPGPVRRVVLDRHEGGGGVVGVDVSAPLGSLVRGHYVDGSTQLQVHGGWTSRYSQVAGPLWFGSGIAGDRLVSVSLQRPGEDEGKRIAVQPGDRVALD